MKKEGSVTSLTRGEGDRRSVLAKLQALKILDSSEKQSDLKKNKEISISPPKVLSTEDSQLLDFDTNRIKVRKVKKDESLERENDTNLASIERRKFNPNVRFNLRYDKSSKKVHKFMI